MRVWRRMRVARALKCFNGKFFVERIQKTTSPVGFELLNCWARRVVCIRVRCAGLWTRPTLVPINWQSRICVLLMIRVCSSPARID